jgi:class 3 adenylate cyclase
MSAARVLVVDDTPMNVKLLADLLRSRGYEVATAASGPEALASIAAQPPDLVLLDIMRPGMSGYEVCRAIRDDPRTALLPVVLATSLAPHEERVKGIEAGADDFLSKPINQSELFARVKSLLRIKSLQDEVKRWNQELEERVRVQVAQLDRLERLKGFFSADLAEAIVSGGGDDLLKPHRREITVVFLDVRGFTAFTDASEPEEVMEFLRQFHRLVGTAVTEHQGTIERFAGDGMMIFFNDPIALPDAPRQAVRMALAVQRRFQELRGAWLRMGHELGLGIGVAVGYATLGTIGFEGRRDYAAIGPVTNLAARLCSEAHAGQTLCSRKAAVLVEGAARAKPVGPLVLKGFAAPVEAFELTELEKESNGQPAQG